MQCAAWPHLKGDLSSTRRAAAAFLDNLTIESRSGDTDRRSWLARWLKVGHDHSLLGDLSFKDGALDEAAEAWLSALTAFELVRRLDGEDDAQSADTSAKVGAGIQKFELSLGRKIEKVQIACCDQTIPAFYLLARNRESRGPAVICISGEQETGATLLGRLLPEVFGRDLSILVVSHDDVASHSRSQSSVLLSCCLDYLSGRPEVDATRIGIYGEGFSAAIATDFARFDRRLAAAVCDGGLWNWLRMFASVGWLTKVDAAADEPGFRSKWVRQVRCPVLVVAGGRGIASVSEAIKLEADCAVANIDLELAIAGFVSSSVEGIENFVTADGRIFSWLEQKLTHPSVQSFPSSEEQDRQLG